MVRPAFEPAEQLGLASAADYLSSDTYVTHGHDVLKLHSEQTIVSATRSSLRIKVEEPSITLPVITHSHLRTVERGIGVF
jgi:hypothetical protein